MFQGVGSGTTSERQKQYEQLRVAQATNRIYQYRLKKLAPEGDNALLAKDKRAARTRKIRLVIKPKSLTYNIRTLVTSA